MARRRPEPGINEAAERAAIAMLRRQKHGPDQRNDDDGRGDEGGDGHRRLPPAGSIDNLPHLRSQSNGVPAEFVA
jgi:hypothetical protein